MADRFPDGPNHPDDDPQGQPNPFAGTPLEQMFGAAGGQIDMQAMFGQLQRMFAPHEGAVNWEYVRDLSRQVVATQPDPSPDAALVSRVQDAARLAELWLDKATDFPATGTTAAVWSRAEWVENAMPAWQRLVEPVAKSVVDAMGNAMPEEARALAGPMVGMLNQLGGAMFSQQIGQAVGGLAQEVVSASDIGVPLSQDHRPALVPANIAAFGSGLGVSDDDVLLYLMLRECAHQRLFAAVPWLSDALFAAVAEYGEGITIDTSKIEQSLTQLDPSDINAMQEALGGGLFDLEPTAAQRAALERLETTLALVEGWVDEVVGQAATDVMPASVPLREAVRRRRASGGPAEATFAALVGLELRPRRLRDASAMWGAVRAADGTEARDAVWAHPQLLPTAADLDDPIGFAQRTREADDLDVDSPEFDEALTALLDSDRKPGRDDDSGDRGTPAS